jgi:hypothetical protein
MISITPTRNATISNASICRPAAQSIRLLRCAAILRNFNAWRAVPRLGMTIAVIAIRANNLDQANLSGNIGRPWHGFVCPALRAFERHVGGDIERFHAVARGAGGLPGGGCYRSAMISITPTRNATISNASICRPAAQSIRLLHDLIL